MLKEDYVSFETAKLLKDKGFDGCCFMVYDKYGAIDYAMESYGEDEVCNSECSEGDVTAPTIQTAMRSIREKKGLCIEPYRTAAGYLYTISRIPTGSCLANPSDGGDDEDSGQWTTYEGACDAAIRYCLEHKFY